MKMIFHRCICACVLILSRSNSFRPQNGSFQIKLFKINHVFGEINMNTEYISEIHRFCMFRHSNGYSILCWVFTMFEEIIINFHNICFFFSLTPIWKTLKIDLLQYNFHLLITQLWPNAKLQTIQVKRRNRICKIHPQLACHKQENMCSSNFISKRNRWESIGKKHGYCFVNHAQMDPLNESSIRI